MEEAAAAELPPQATPPKTPDAMPGSNGPPAVPPEVQAIIAQDSLSRQGTPSRERKELWELLNLPEGESFRRGESGKRRRPARDGGQGGGRGGRG